MDDRLRLDLRPLEYARTFRKKQKAAKFQRLMRFFVAERAGFEPALDFHLNTLSRRAT